ncbi:hypothetical protein H0H92_015671 [Tricholoma furcatifolium]|nr:hypothetical protein H0H92_015671 [Tricholoma furcatifolium]
MSSIVQYLSYALSRLSFTGPSSAVDDPATPSTPQSLFSVSSITSLARGFLLSSPYLKGSFTDASFASDTSTSSSCSDMSASSTSEDSDVFSPPRHSSSNSPLVTPSPLHPIGLGISGVPRKDGKPGDFDGLGFVGVRRSFNPRGQFPPCTDDDEDDDGYNSPTPLRAPQPHQTRDRGEEELSETFIRELIFTWEADPQHTRVLCTIPECEDEEIEFPQAANMDSALRPACSSAKPSSGPSSPPRASSSPSLPQSPASPSPSVRSASQWRVSSSSSAAIHRTQSRPSISRPPSRTAHRTDSRLKSSSPSDECQVRGRTLSRAKKPSGLRSTSIEGVVRMSNKKKTSVKAAWRH